MARGSESVLLVEDEGQVRGLAREILETCGYRVLEAACAEEAISIYENLDCPVDLVITDVVMPGLSGRQLAERLREVSPGLRVIYMSGYTNDAVVQRGVMEASAEFLQKPFTAASLARKVRDVLDA